MLVLWLEHKHRINQSIKATTILLITCVLIKKTMEMGLVHFVDFISHVEFECTL